MGFGRAGEIGGVLGVRCIALIGGFACDDEIMWIEWDANGGSVWKEGDHSRHLERRRVMSRNEREEGEELFV